MAWIAWHQPETHELRVAARWGDTHGYLDRIRVYGDEREEGRGPAGTAFREARPVICNDFQNDPRTLPWRDAARISGWQASGAIPLRVSDAERGVLVILVKEAGFFGAREVELLEEVAAHIVLVLKGFEKEERLAEAEARYRGALDGMIEGCMLIDFGWHYLYLNDAAAHQGRGRREELLGRSMLDAYPGVENSVIFGYYRRCMEERVPQRFEEKFEFPSGEVAWYEMRVTPVPEGIFILSMDVTERRQAEEMHRILVSLIETAHEIIGIATLDGEVTYLNPAAKALVGKEDFDPSEKLRHTDFVAPEALQSFVEVAMPTLLREGWYRGETRGRNFRTGESIPVDVEMLVIRGANGEPIRLATVSRDLTEQKEAERQRAHLEMQLAQAQKMEALGRLTGGIAHDFNNSLTVILGYSDLLASSGKLTEKERNAVGAIQAAGQRSRELVSQLMGFSRQQVISPRPLDLNQAIAAERPMLARLVGEDIELKVGAGENLWSVLLDPSQVDQVLMNLAANARDAMPDGGELTLETRNVTVDEVYARGNPAAQVGDYVVLSASDTGVGMDAQTVSRVFEPFFTTKERGKGTGLGLATVYGIVRQNRGFIDVYSEPGMGTIFKVYFPRLAVANEEVATARPETPPAGRGGTILLVEDDELVRGMTAEALRTLGFTPLLAGDVEEALALCRDTGQAIDLVISDVFLPEMKGTALRERIVELRPGVKILFISGYTSDMVMPARILRAGAYFLQKPFSFDSLGAKIREILAGR